MVKISYGKLSYQLVYVVEVLALVLVFGHEDDTNRVKTTWEHVTQEFNV